MFWKNKKAIKVFYSYTFRDKRLRDVLEMHLTPLERAGQITTWCDREISPGTDWHQEISKHIYTADIILLLISPDFISSYYSYGQEMQAALTRHHWGEARAIPILLRPVLWELTPLDDLQALPLNGKPISLWRNLDAALLDVAKSISDLVKTSEWRGKRDAQYDVEKYNEALANYEQAIQSDPQDATAYLGKGFVLCRLRRYKEALTAYEQAIQFDPHDATAYLGRGNTLWCLEEHDAAMKDYQIVRAITGEWPGPSTPGDWSLSRKF